MVAAKIIRPGFELAFLTKDKSDASCYNNFIAVTDFDVILGTHQAEQK